MERNEAYPITYGILGLLAFWGPLSGYDIKRLFDHMLAPMWGAAHSQIYKELRRMEELGWVDMRREEQEARPDRKVYSMTDKGGVALHQWQAQPPDVFQMRDAALVRGVRPRDGEKRARAEGLEFFAVVEFEFKADRFGY